MEPPDATTCVWVAENLGDETCSSAGGSSELASRAPRVRPDLRMGARLRTSAPCVALELRMDQSSGRDSELGLPERTCGKSFGKGTQGLGMDSETDPPGEALRIEGESRP